MTERKKYRSIYNILFKRMLDIFFSFILLILLFPLMVILIVFNCFFTKCKPLFIQKRCGKSLKPFFILKLRTLKNNAPSYVEKSDIDMYTKIGFFLRKSHLDEIYQLFNILFGQMSFIGPRPIILSLTKQIEQRIQDETIYLRPGLSGLAQIEEKDVELTQIQKCEYDKEYLNKLSFKTDLLIFLKTFNVVFSNIFRKKVSK